jgi:hypothetical protein
MIDGFEAFAQSRVAQKQLDEAAAIREILDTDRAAKYVPRLRKLVAKGVKLRVAGGHYTLDFKLPFFWFSKFHERAWDIALSRVLNELGRMGYDCYHMGGGQWRVLWGAPRYQEPQAAPAAPEEQLPWE